MTISNEVSHRNDGLTHAEWQDLEDWRPEDQDPEVNTPESNSGYDENVRVELEDER